MSFWRKQPLDRNFVSDIDRFLQAFDKRPEAYSISRRAEEAKYARVFRLRDQAEKEEPTDIWD